MKKSFKIVFLLFFCSLLLSCTHDESNASYSGKKGQLQLEGIVLNVPNKSSLELALFALDNENKPKQLLAIERYKGNGSVLNFRVDFKLDNDLSFKALELRGRVMQSGQLVGYLAPWHKQQLTQQDLKGIILELIP